MKFISFISDKNNGIICNKYAADEVVIENRQKIFNSLGLDQSNVIRVDIGHSREWLEIRSDNRGEWSKCLGSIDHKCMAKYEGFISNTPGIILEINVADSGAYIFHNETYNIIALINSGRVGSINEILKKTVIRMAELSNVSLSEFTKDLKVELSPAILSKSYALDYIIVDKEKVEDWTPFVGHDKFNTIDYPGSNKVKLVFQDDNTNKLHLDFRGYNKKLLENMGVKKENMKISNICTYESDDYPSYVKYIEGLGEDGRFMVVATFFN